MDELTKGTWIVNSVKKLTAFQQNAAALQEFEATEQAGKAANLLARLQSETDEILPAKKVRAFARESFISAGELKHTLDLLKREGKVDYTVNDDGQPSEVENYCFSSREALETATRVFGRLEPSQVEESSIASLQETYSLPRTEGELREKLSDDFEEDSVTTALSLQRELQLVRTTKVDDETVFFNEYAFADGGEKIALALRGLKEGERQAVEDVMQLVSDHQGQPLDSLEKLFPRPVMELMQGVGLLDPMPVYSQNGEATFLTTPHLKGITVDGPLVSADVFHKAKSLLNCLRYGQYKSTYRRGAIDSNEKMLNIVRKLNRGATVGPCTAIGQDYVMLETSGVIETEPYAYGMFNMRLRQKEVGRLVLQMLLDNRVDPALDPELARLLQSQAIGFRTPEDTRTAVLAARPPVVQAVTERFMQAIRSSGKVAR